jgi:membrane peptidoglycan carboxypeptidase
MTHVHGIHVFGGTFPAQIWHTFMVAAARNQTGLRFTQSTATLHWHRWCGRFQYARNYVDARPTNGCTPHTTAARTTTTTATTTTTRTTTTTAHTTATTTPPTTTQPTTTTTPATTAETTTTTPTTTSGGG